MALSFLRCFSYFMLGLSGLALFPGTGRIQSLQASLQPNQKLGDIDILRYYFHSYLGDHGLAEDIDHLLLYPNQTILKPPVSSDYCLQQKSLRLRNTTLDHLKGIGPNRPFRTIAAPANPQSREQNPPTMVIFPGIFGEFIENRPFEEVLVNQDSLLSRRWQEILKTTATTALMSEAYHLKKQKEAPIHVEHLYSLASIDLPGDVVLANVIYLKPPFGSLETLGSIDSKRALYGQRLEKIFSLIDLPGPVFFLGYSQGALVALDLVSQNYEAGINASDWYQKLRGVISLGGPLFGSGIADLAKTKGEPNAEIIRIFETIAEKLHLRPASRLKIPRTFASNSKIWKEGFDQVKDLLERSPDDGPNPYEFQRRVELSCLVSILYKALVKNFEIHHSLKYFDNIGRFKHFVREASTAISELGSSSRWTWWQNHSLPPHIKYFSISGTMPGIENLQDVAPVAPEETSSGYGVNTGDFLVLKASYDDFIDHTGIYLNDSQVAIHSSMFWPQLHQSLNPRQAPYSAHFLGILGTHHWGMAFPYAFENKTDETNQFPRSTFLKALASTIIDLSMR